MTSVSGWQPPRTPAIDVADESFVVAPPAALAARFAHPLLRREWWPELELTVVRNRGVKGIRWAVSGALNGTAEIWLEPWRDGTIVHWFLRADPVDRRRSGPERIKRSYVTAYKSRMFRLKDEVERERPVGASSVRAGR